jgi:DNA-binding NtrC family response regulator
MKKAIICVDDETVIIDSLLEQLERTFGSSYIFEGAENADEALELIDELIEDGTEIALIVSDWLMPGMKGDEFLIKAHEMLPNTKKILLTGQATMEAVDNARKNANLHAYIEKPWLEDELIKSIKNGIEG